MAISTPIQWCDSACNPVMGCAGCELHSPEGKFPSRCYAAALHARRGGVSRGYAPRFELPTLYPGRMAAAAAWPDLTGTARPEKSRLDGRPRHVFISDMGDALSAGEFLGASDLREHEPEQGQRRFRPAAGAIRSGGVPFEFLEREIVDVARSEQGSRHVWMWLTKLPGRARRFSDWLWARGVRWPENLWIGASVTAPESLGRIGQLAEVGDERTVRFVSAEPLWAEVSLREFLERGAVHWVIAGGESKQGREAPREFKLEWARALRDECEEHGVPFFLKQLGAAATVGGEPFRSSDRHGGDWAEFPEDLRRRQVPAWIG